MVTIYTTRFNIEFRPHVADEVYSVIAKSFIMSVRLSVRMEELGTHWMYFYEIWYWHVFWKSVEEI